MAGDTQIVFAPYFRMCKVMRSGTGVLDLSLELYLNCSSIFLGGFSLKAKIGHYICYGI